MSQEIVLDLSCPSVLTWANIAGFAAHLTALVVVLNVSDFELQFPVYRSTYTVVERNETEWRVLPTGHTVVGWLDATGLTCSFFAISSIFHFGNAFLWRKTYVDQIRNCVNVSRWVEYSFSAPVMFVLISYAVGLMHLSEIVLGSALIHSVMLFGLAQEVYNRPASDREWERRWPRRAAFHFVGYGPFICAWFVVLYQFHVLSTLPSTEGTRMPDFVYAIVYAEAALFSCFAVVQFVQILLPPAKYMLCEYAYISLSFASKLTLGLLVSINTLRQGKFDALFRVPAESLLSQSSRA